MNEERWEMMKGSEERKDIVREVFDGMPKAAQDALRDVLFKAETPGDVNAFLMIGPCPHCGNELTKDGDDVGFPSDECGDATVGVCTECEYHWCLECGQELHQWPCPHWDAWDAYCKANGIVPDEGGEMCRKWMENC